MFADHPLTGVGPQVYDVLNGAYGIHKPQWTIAHNAYVQVLVDIGIVGAAVVLIGGVITARSLLWAWQSSTPKDRLIIAACVAAIVATLVHGLCGFAADMERRTASVCNGAGDRHAVCTGTNAKATRYFAYSRALWRSDSFR